MVFFATVEETDGNLFTGLEISSDAQDTVRGGGGRVPRQLFRECVLFLCMYLRLSGPLVVIFFQYF